MPSSKRVSHHISIEHCTKTVGIYAVVLYNQHTVFNRRFIYFSNSLVFLQGKVSSDRCPDEWYGFTTMASLDRTVSRGSEKTHNELKDPIDWSSDKIFRKHFLEKNLTRSLAKINALVQILIVASIRTCNCICI